MRIGDIYQESMERYPSDIFKIVYIERKDICIGIHPCLHTCITSSSITSISTYMRNKVSSIGIVLNNSCIDVSVLP